MFENCSPNIIGTQVSGTGLQGQFIRDLELIILIRCQKGGGSTNNFKDKRGNYKNLETKSAGPEIFFVPYEGVYENFTLKEGEGSTKNCQTSRNFDLAPIQ